MEMECASIEGGTTFTRRVGRRFAIFRCSVLKSQKDFALETGLSEEYIESFEKGLVIPNTLLLAHFFREYGLNVTWLLFGVEKIFYKKSKRVPPFVYRMDRIMHYNSVEFKENLEFLEDVRRLELDEREIQSIKTMDQLRRQYENLKEKSENANIIRFPGNFH
jgi:transcriptional regulator with XRE-family HTH domain